MENLTKEQIIENILNEYKTTIKAYLSNSNPSCLKKELYAYAMQMSEVLACIGYSEEDEKQLIAELRAELGLN